MKIAYIALILILAVSTFADDQAQLYEKAYFLETAKGKTEEALEIYREIVATEATDENRAVVLNALKRLQLHYELPKSVEFQTGGSHFQNGDFIKIDQILGSTEGFEVGETYIVKGRYNLSSHDDATLSFFVTATEKGDGRTGISPKQQVLVKKGSGTFELSLAIPYTGWPHISFYPVDGGNGFGGIYFGADEWLLKEITWRNQPVSLQEKIDAFDMKRGDLENVKEMFGSPTRYLFGKEVFDESDLPVVYIMDYADGFRILMHGGEMKEFRFEGDPLYTISGITIGNSLKSVLSILGQPRKTVRNRECAFEERVLYKNSTQWGDGHAYYADKGLRLFFMNEKLVALYVTDNTRLNTEQ